MKPGSDWGFSEIRPSLREDISELKTSWKLGLRALESPGRDLCEKQIRLKKYFFKKKLRVDKYTHKPENQLSHPQ